LHDGPLTIQQITAIDIPDASLAYLSACDTYRGGSAIPDEGITLAAALQLAGYSHVVATLWQIGVITSDVSRNFYNQVLVNQGGITRINVGESGRALRAAIEAVRQKSPGIPPMLWASYIHTGP
jgi:CHAT domain-containing protein